MIFSQLIQSPIQESAVSITYKVYFHIRQRFSHFTPFCRRLSAIFPHAVSENKQIFLF